MILLCYLLLFIFVCPGGKKKKDTTTDSDEDGDEGHSVASDTTSPAKRAAECKLIKLSHLWL